MAEILTESFCERCGTRYTFEAGTRRRTGTGRIRTLSRGVKNFVANDNTSFSQALAAAREDDIRTASMQQLDAFHLTFNFCMGCRQYTCRRCWNSDIGECLSCAPDPGLDSPSAQLPGRALTTPEAAVAPTSGAARSKVAAPAWPTTDVKVTPPEALAAGLPATESIDPTEADLTPAELAAIESALMRHAGRADGVPAESPATMGDEPATGATPGAPTPVAAPPKAAQPAAVDGAQPTEPEPALAESAAESPVAAGAEPGAPEAAALEPITGPGVPEVAVAPESLPADTAAPPWRVVAPATASSEDPKREPRTWGSTEGATRREDDAMPASPWAARVATARPVKSPVWAASSRDILAGGAPGTAAPAGVQSCAGCGLALSANARFCRRCGARQG